MKYKEKRRVLSPTFSEVAFLLPQQVNCLKISCFSSRNSHMNKAPFKNEIHTLSAILLYLGFLLFATSFFKCCCLTTTKSEESLMLRSS